MCDGDILSMVVFTIIGFITHTRFIIDPLWTTWFRCLNVKLKEVTKRPLFGYFKGKDISMSFPLNRNFPCLLGTLIKFYIRQRVLVFFFYFPWVFEKNPDFLFFVTIPVPFGFFDEVNVFPFIIHTNQKKNTTQRCKKSH